MSDYKTHRTGRVMLTLKAALEVAAKFREMKKFSVTVEEFGCDTGCYEVVLTSTNARSGNHNTFSVTVVPATEKEYKFVAKAATGKASERDSAALARMASERAVVRE